MCELLGISSRDRITVNEPLKEFYSHSREHPNGWGMAVFYENAVSLEKEPLPAYRSAYLKERLHHKLEVRNMIGHIRKATIGMPEFGNCHPFVKRDNYHRTWTLAHNGTIFHCPALDPYVHTQEGGTDSERILYHIVAQMNKAQTAAGRALDAEERFALLDRLVCEIAPRNKLNLLIYDSELMYVHTNYANSLYVRRMENTAFFATVPLDRSNWQPFAFTTLCAYQDGHEQYRGTCHGGAYIDNLEDMKFIYADFAGL